MKVTTTFAKQDEEVKYPCLMINIDTGTIALFSKPNTGVILKQGGMSRIGDYKVSWTDSFKPFDGSITLQND